MSRNPDTFDISKPRWNQSTFNGRMKHFFTITDPRNIFYSNEALNEAKKIVMDYRNLNLEQKVPIEKYWVAKKLYDSAFHPENGEKLFLIGRMSFQVPGNLFLTCGMLTFYKSIPAVIFWQWLNQSFNAIVNYTNRSGSEALSTRALVTAYISATSCAVTTAIFLNNLSKKLPPFYGKLIPFCAVAVANFVNIPLMRQRELSEGIPLFDSSEDKICLSKNAAIDAIAMVVFSRICMAMPGLVIPPVISSYLERFSIFKKNPKILFPLNISIIGLCIAIATPMCCAIFPQKSQIKVRKLEDEAKTVAMTKGLNENSFLFFNKGL